MPITRDILNMLINLNDMLTPHHFHQLSLPSATYYLPTH